MSSDGSGCDTATSISPAEASRLWLWGSVAPGDSEDGRARRMADDAAEKAAPRWLWIWRRQLTSKEKRGN